MYESRFGITGPPFQLSPDPTFYFDSRGHHRALAELRAGLESDSGFIVVSGEVGAGKTTLVRTLLGEIDSQELAVAHVVSTQLDAEELLAAACIGFGLPVSDTPRDELASKLLRFLLKLDKEGRRAVLIIDEAQNLRRDAFDRLLMATGKSARRLPLQVYLVGQPELQQAIDTPEFAKLKAEVSVSWHLGPIELGEAGPYIEHRLRKVGWNGMPAFEAGAFDEIFRWTGGIPRRINLLCNRLMLACFLAGHERIDAALVADTARDLRAELGESVDEPPAGEAARESTQVPSQVRAPRLSDPLFEPMEPGPLLCVVAGHADHVRASALMRAFAARRDLPAAKLVRVHNNDALAMHGTLFDGLHIERALINLSIPETGSATDGEELKKVFEFVVDHVIPNAIVVFDGSDAALACATVARAKGVPVVHVGAGLRVPGDGREAEVRKATDEIADLLYTTDAQASETLVDEGVPPERVHCVGNLLMDAMQAGLRTAAGAALGRDGGPGAPPFLVDRNGYAVVVLARSVDHADRHVLGEVLAILRDLSRDIPLVWPVAPKVDAQLRKVRLEGIFSGERIARLPPQSYPEYLDLLRHATCVLTDSWSTQEEATALGVPCLTLGPHPERPVTASAGSNTYIGNNRALARRVLWECIFNGGKRGRVPDMWDGKTAGRIAGYLAAWLPAVEHATSD